MKLWARSRYAWPALGCHPSARVRCGRRLGTSQTSRGGQPDALHGQATSSRCSLVHRIGRRGERATWHPRTFSGLLLRAGGAVFRLFTPSHGESNPPSGRAVASPGAGSTRCGCGSQAAGLPTRFMRLLFGRLSRGCETIDDMQSVGVSARQSRASRVLIRPDSAGRHRSRFGSGKPNMALLCGLGRA